MDVPRRLTDSTLGDWINARLLDHSAQGVRAGSVVPTGFPRVVRVLHPAGDGRTWAEVAQGGGNVVHPLVQWKSIRPHRGPWCSDVDPEEGSIPAATLDAVLAHCPANGEVTYGVWVGFGTWRRKDDHVALMPGWGGRDYLLFAADKRPITQWPGMDPLWPQSANLIWPADCSWCIATEIDWDSTLIACSDEVADALLTDPRLESFDVQYEDDLSWDGDTSGEAQSRPRVRSTS